MERLLLTIEGRDVALGLRWHSGKNIQSIEQDEYLDRYRSDKLLIVEEDGLRASIGFLENTIEDSEYDDLKVVSAAAALTKEMPSGIALIKLDERDGLGLTGPVYWGVIINKGVPEFDLVSEDLDSVIKPLKKRLENRVNKVLNGKNSFLRTNLKGDDSSAFVDVINTAKRNQLADLAVTNYGLGDIEFLISQLKKSEFLLVNPRSGLNMQNIFSKLDREEIILITALVLMVFAGVFFLTNDNEIDDFDLPIVKPVQTGPVVDPIAKAKEIVNYTLHSQLLGSNGLWLQRAIDRYMDLPKYTGGYVRGVFECKLVDRLCGAVYTREKNHADFDISMAALRPKFDTVTFDSNGGQITGVFKIEENTLFAPDRMIEVKDLPLFDSGESLVSKVVGLNNVRPGLTVSVSSSEKVTIKSKEKGFIMPSSIKTVFVSTSWSAEGRYMHQLKAVLDKIVVKSVTVNSIRLTDNGSGAIGFKIQGGYLMQGGN